VGVEGEVAGARPHRDGCRHLGRVAQPHPGHGRQDELFDIVRGAELEAQRHRFDDLGLRQRGRHRQEEGGVAVDLVGIEPAGVEGRLGLREGDREVAGGDHGVEELADQAVEAREAGARLGVVVGGQVVEAVALREGEQPAGQPQQLVEQPLGRQGGVAQQVGEGGAGAAGGVQQPERGDVARAELDDVLGRFPVQAVERVDLGPQGVELAAQQVEQGRGAVDAEGWRHEGRVELEAVAGGAADARDGRAWYSSSGSWPALRRVSLLRVTTSASAASEKRSMLSRGTSR
jgi:hypothetical protein